VNSSNNRTDFQSHFQTLITSRCPALFCDDELASTLARGVTSPLIGCTLARGVICSTIGSCFTLSRGVISSLIGSRSGPKFSGSRFSAGREGYSNKINKITEYASTY